MSRSLALASKGLSGTGESEETAVELLISRARDTDSDMHVVSTATSASLSMAMAKLFPGFLLGWGGGSTTERLNEMKPLDAGAPSDVERDAGPFINVSLARPLGETSR